uniref:Uncharacterized protein n=1 Tax=Neogobius melanostomus TaxID=47308 RepID=A0A8C6T927_9GOBI
KFYKEQFNREKGRSSYSRLRSLPELEHAMEVSRHQSQVQPLRSVIQHGPLMSLTDVSAQVKYKEGVEHQRPCYNPLDCVSFKHTQAAGALASQVKYRSGQKEKAEAACDLPNLLQLQHALHASKLQSSVEYKRQYKQNKAQYHLALDTAEQRHHKDNAVLHSQVKYREEYERSRGRSQMELCDTEAYRVSREAQRRTSEKEYRRDYEEQVKGKALIEVDQTPGYKTALLASKEYRKDREELRGRGFSEETPELLRAKNATSILNEVLACLWNQGLLLRSCGTRFCNHTYLTVVLQKEYRRDREELRGRGLSEETPELLRAKNATSILNPPYSQYSLRLHMSAPLFHVLTLGEPDGPVCLQKKYRDEAQKQRSSYSLGSDTPDMERVRTNQRQISSVRNRHTHRLKSSTAETPEIVLARDNAKNISQSVQVQYRDEPGRGTAVTETPELERVRRNQDNISTRGRCIFMFSWYVRGNLFERQNQ